MSKLPEDTEDNPPTCLQIMGGYHPPPKPKKKVEKCHLQLAFLRGELEGLVLRIFHPRGGQGQQGADGGLVVDQVDEPGPGGTPLGWNPRDMPLKLLIKRPT